MLNCIEKKGSMVEWLSYNLYIENEAFENIRMKLFCKDFKNIKKHCKHL